MKKIIIALLLILAASNCFALSSSFVGKKAKLNSETATWSRLALPTNANQRVIDGYVDAIKWGAGITLSSLTVQKSLATNLFFTQSSVPLGWLANTPWKGVLSDGSKTLTFYMGAAGIGETYQERFTNGDFSGTWASNVPQGWTVSGTQDDNYYLVGDDTNNRLRVVALAGTSSMGVYQDVGVVGSLNKYTLDIYQVTSGQIKIQYGAGTALATYGTTGIKTGYLNHAGTGTVVYIVRVAGCDITIASVSSQIVLSPDATTGLWIKDITEEATFDRNKATYTATFTRN